MSDQVMAAPTFAEDARAAFRFLEGYGYICSDVTPRMVRFDSQKVCIAVSHAKADGEVSITFGRRSTLEEFSFTLFLRLVNLNLEKGLGERLANEPHEVRRCLDLLATTLRSEGRAIVKGDDAVFDRMKSVRWWDFDPDALKKS